MRVAAEQQAVVRETAATITNASVRIHVFGSRLDDPARGRSLDVLLERVGPSFHCCNGHGSSLRWKSVWQGLWTLSAYSTVLFKPRFGLPHADEGCYCEH